MDARSRVISSSLIVGAALVLSIITAVVLFKYMDSSAEGSIRDWKFGGAFAGFFATFLVITNGVSLFFQKFSDEENRGC